MSSKVVPLNGFGGSGGDILNFKIVGGTTQPVNPSENMIWVNTDQTITDWIFTVDEPENPVEGMVWIATGTSSSTIINVIKRNNILVYPIATKQYINNEWISVTAMTYQNQQWSFWYTFICLNSQDQTEITNGWVAEARTQNVSGAGTRVPSINTTTMTFGYQSAGAVGGVVRTKNKILIDKNRTKLVCETLLATNPNSSTWLSFVVWSNMGTYWDTNAVTYTIVPSTTSNQKTILDVTNLDGEYYIGFFLYTDTGITIKNIYLE